MCGSSNFAEADAVKAFVNAGDHAVAAAVAAACERKLLRVCVCKAAPV